MCWVLTFLVLFFSVSVLCTSCRLDLDLYKSCLFASSRSRLSVLSFFLSRSHVCFVSSLRQIISLGLFIHFWREGEEIFLAFPLLLLYTIVTCLTLLLAFLSVHPFASARLLLACCSPSCPRLEYRDTYIHTYTLHPYCPLALLPGVQHRVPHTLHSMEMGPTAMLIQKIVVTIKTTRMTGCIRYVKL